MEYFSIKIDEKNDNLVINKKIGKRYGLLKLKSTIVRFGYRVSEIKITIDEKLKNNEILVSDNVLKKLSMPTFCKYNILINEDKEVNFGPFIGIYIGKKQATAVKRLRFLSSYVERYKEFFGVVVIITLDSLNKENLLLDGLIYNPNKNVWEKAQVPFPSSIFIRSPLEKKWREFFASLYGDKLYNYKTFNKWEMFTRLKDFPKIKRHLPETIIYKQPQEVLSFLRKWNDVYIKPIAGKQGLGIYNMQLKKKNVIVKSRKDGKNLKWTFSNKKELLNFLEKNFYEEQFIVQRTIDIEVNEQVMDFRVGIDKDQRGKWKNLMFVSRISGQNSIVSNRAVGGGEVQPIPDVLKNVYKLKGRQVKKYEKALISLAIDSAKALEQTGLSLGKLAFDFGIDKDKKIWIIEINSRYPDDSLANVLDDRKTYNQIRLANMLYAKKLAGFEVSSNNEAYCILKEEYNDVEANKRMKIYASVLYKNRRNFKELLIDEANKNNLVGFSKFNKQLKKYDIEVEGKRKDINNFLNKINYGEELSNKVILAIEEISAQYTERSFNHNT